MVRAAFLLFMSAGVAFVVSRGCGLASQSISEPAPMHDVPGGVCKLGTSC